METTPNRFSTSDLCLVNISSAINNLTPGGLRSNNTAIIGYPAISETVNSALCTTAVRDSGISPIQ